MEFQKKFESEKKTKNQQENHEQQEEQDLKSIKNLHQLTDNENKSASELFDSISNRIHALAIYLTAWNPENPDKKIYIREDDVIDQIEKILAKIGIEDPEILKDTLA